MKYFYNIFQWFCGFHVSFGEKLSGSGQFTQPSYNENAFSGLKTVAGLHWFGKKVKQKCKIWFV